MVEITLDSLRQDSQEAVDKANESLDQQNTKYKPDPRFWKPIIPTDGNSEYVVRFLPNAHGTTPPFVPIHKFQFKVGNTWYINNSRETIGEKDPCNELTMKDSNTPSIGRDEVRKQGRMRKTVNIANILVIQDRVNPGNEGKVMLYEFTRQILDKVQEAIKPNYDEKPINIFDLEAGPNFIIRTKKQNGMVNYLDSKFSTELKPIADTQDGILEIAKQTVDLYEFINPDNFKSYEELKAQLDNVMANALPGTTTANTTANAGFGNAPAQQPQGGSYNAGVDTNQSTGQPQSTPTADFNYPDSLNDRPAGHTGKGTEITELPGDSTGTNEVVDASFFENNMG